MSALGYILMFYIGFYFYRLAENQHKNKWLFGVLGMTIYFIGLFIYPLYLNFFSKVEIEEYNMIVISLESFTIGIIFVFISFQILSFIWNRKKKIDKKELEKIGK